MDGDVLVNSAYVDRDEGQPFRRTVKIVLGALLEEWERLVGDALVDGALLAALRFARAAFAPGAVTIEMSSRFASRWTIATNPPGPRGGTRVGVEQRGYFLTHTAYGSLVPAATNAPSTPAGSTLHA